MLPEVAILLVSALVGWIFFQRQKADAVLSKIPGPKRVSWIKGHVEQVHSLYGWDFHEMMESYGPTTVYDNWFGKKILYTWDTKAMQHILIKVRTGPLFLGPA
uniref:Cytochrome p450 n=1 Tax=Moniliophthora roreri TaxID=221103 RepID=A0A0W0EVE7_MONRR